MPDRIIDIQVAPSAIQPEETATGTNLILPPLRVADRLRHFPDSVYDLTPESHLVKFMKALLGDAGVGRLKKLLHMQRMRATLQGSHFYDLDRFYGPLFGIKRSPNEVLNIDPYQGLATRDEWDDTYARDASFRSRIEQLARAIPFGPTPTGMELIAEAVLAQDVDIYESFNRLSAGFVTHEDIEFITNDPLFEDDMDAADNWNATNEDSIASSAEWAFDGSNSLKVVADGLGDLIVESDPIPWTGDASFATAFSIVVAAHGDNTAPLQAIAEIDLYDDNPTLLGTATGDATDIGPYGDDGDVMLATCVNVVAEPPINASTDTVVLRITIPSPANGDTFYFDRSILTQWNLSVIEDETYAFLEGYGWTTPDKDSDRRTFVVQPKRGITPADAHNLSRVLDRLKPADSRYEIVTRDNQVYDEVPIVDTAADSVYWEVISEVNITTPLGSEIQLPYTKLSDQPEEQPRPPFSGYQGEAWSYVSEIIGIAASKRSGEDTFVLPNQIVLYEHDDFDMEDPASAFEYAEFPPANAVFPIRLVQAGRSVSDAIMLAYPYPISRYAIDPQGRETSVLQIQDQLLVEKRSSTAPFLSTYVDGIPLDALNRTLEILGSLDPFQQNPEHRYWVTERREKTDDTEEIIEFRMKRNIVNYVTYEVPKYPHRSYVEVRIAGQNEWINAAGYDAEGVPRPANEVLVSSPLYWGNENSRITEGHPDHNYAGHWQKVSVRFDVRSLLGLDAKDIRTVDAVRVRMHRIGAGPGGETLAPRRRGIPSRPGEKPTDTEQAYTLAVRSFDVGYRVFTRSDFDFITDNSVIAETRDQVGALLQFRVQEQTPDRAIDSNSVTAWRSEPQPVNYAVVNFYMDLGSAQTIDRLYIDPTHSGAKFNIYYSKEDLESDGSEEFFANLVWRPIPRSYSLQKGYVHLPPTKARYFKLEFTNLVPELYESFVPINRKTKFFPPSVVEHSASGMAETALLPGMNSLIDNSSEPRYRDALQALMNPDTLTPGDYRPTEAIYVRDPEGQKVLRNQSWTFGFLPWHQDDSFYPKFARVGRHHYQEIEVLHNYKTAFFVGLREIKAYRVRYAGEDNTEVYFDTFDDDRNIALSQWSQGDGRLFVESPPSTVTSHVFGSRDHIKALQFATVQSDPVQLVPDHSFRDISFWPSYTWDDPDKWLRVGEAQMVYSVSEYSVTVIRMATVPADSGTSSPYDSIIRPLIEPVFATSPWDAELIENSTEGGFSTPAFVLTSGRKAYGAARFTMITDQTSPLVLQIYDNINGLVVAEKELPARRGETVEAYLPFDSSVGEARVRLVQKGKSNDIWKVLSLACFEDQILWEFSVNGGEDWYAASEIRNNENGILTFPIPGNQLRWRATANRAGQWISALKIRPHYLGQKNARASSNNRGPNLSVYDEDIPINADPLFTSWNKPIPYWWFAASRRFPVLAVEGAASGFDFPSFYGRSITDDTALLISDGATVEIAGKWRTITDILEGISDEADLTVSYSRSVNDTVPEPVDFASVALIVGTPDPIVSPIVDDI